MAWDNSKVGRRRQAVGAVGVLAAALILFCPAASAQTPIGGFSGLSSGTDSKKPIDIESDRLEVDDKKHMAIFIGNVSATQGSNNLKAPRLEVFYENANQQQGADKRAPSSRTAKPVKAANAGTSTDPISNGQIKLIHALGGNVVVTSTKDQQEATGDDAIYDVKAQLITLTGKEVVLSQGPNKVRGTKLQIDLATGKATILTGEASQGTASTGKPRIRAVFQQETGPDGKPLNPLSAPKKEPGAASQPARKPAPAKPDAAPKAGWQPQDR